jgi:hypothetical protein
MKAKLISLLLAGAAAVSVPTGCTGGTTQGYIVATYDSPPPPREEYVYYRPGYVWIHGNWVRDRYAGWRWQNGYYVRERPGYVYDHGRWERRGRQYVWVQGNWRPRGQVVIRDHRRW